VAKSIFAGTVEKPVKADKNCGKTYILWQS